MRKLVFLSIPAIYFVVMHAAFGQSNLENPKEGSYQSGVSLISGWHCDASSIEVLFNGRNVQQVPYGSSREDTYNTCGDTNNGFGLLWNMSLFPTGEHTLEIFADGVKFAERRFQVTQLPGGAFLRGMEAETRIENFPNSETSLVLKWQESNQNFVIARHEKTSSTLACRTNVVVDPWDNSKVELTNGAVFRNELGESYRSDNRYLLMKDRQGDWSLIVSFFGFDRSYPINLEVEPTSCLKPDSYPIQRIYTVSDPNRGNFYYTDINDQVWARTSSHCSGFSQADPVYFLKGNPNDSEGGSSESAILNLNTGAICTFGR